MKDDMTHDEKIEWRKEIEETLHKLGEVTEYKDRI